MENAVREKDRIRLALILVAVMCFAFVACNNSAITTNRNATNGIQGLSLLLFPNGRAHKHRKFIDLHTGQLRSDEMTKLMNENQKAKDKNCENNAHIMPQTEIFVRTYARANRSASRICSRLGCWINGTVSTAPETSS